MIKDLKDYTLEEIETLRASSEAFSRYYSLSQKVQGETFEEQIRSERLKAWCEVTLTTFFDPQKTEVACLYWSNEADRLLSNTFKQFELDQEQLGLFALGKLGSSELNLSSDVDLIFVSKEDPTASSLKKVRRFAKALSKVTELGHCFRVDLDLRPGGHNAPVICSIAQFQEHYWNQAELWERLALVRLRPITGYQSVVDEIQKIRSQFCFRRYVDLTLFDELKKLRPKIHASVSSNGINESLVNLKLAPGFIRDIELFINANQILLAGKVPKLKTPSTSLACDLLAEHSNQSGLFSKLKEHYWFYRQLENQVQAINDSQTHDLDIAQLPKGWNWPNPNELKKRSQFVDKSISQLLGQKEDITNHLKTSLNQISTEDLEKLGFDMSLLGDTWEKIKTSTVPFRHQSSDDDFRVKVIQLFLQELSSSNFDKVLGLKGLADFLTSARAKATLFKLLAQEPRLIKDLSYLFSLSPYLGSFFSSRPELIDIFFLNRDEELSEDLETALLQMSERKRVSEIRGAIGFLKSFDTAALNSNLTSVADTITSKLLKLISVDLDIEDLDVIALGKWGGRELGFRSDLDFVFIAKGEIGEGHHKVARRFISRLRDNSLGGAIYQVDLRLRPDGKGGSLITSWDQIKKYLATSASAWERQAYLKARQVLTNSDGLDLHDWNRDLSPKDIQELKEVRQKLLRPTPSDGFLIKYNSGGLIDVELGLQGAILHQKLKPKSTGTLDFFEALTLMDSPIKENYVFLRRVEQLGRILSNADGDEFKLQTPKFKICSQVLEISERELEERISKSLSENKMLLQSIDPIHQV